MCQVSRFFFFNDTATTEIYTLSLHDALPISARHDSGGVSRAGAACAEAVWDMVGARRKRVAARGAKARTAGSFLIVRLDRKSTRLNSSHANISYAVFCLKKKKTHKALPLSQL